MKSCIRQPVVEHHGTRGAYSDHGENHADHAESGLGLCDVRGTLRETHGFDGRVQRSDGIFPFLPSLGLRPHGPEVSIFRC
jgi:hypothetical protein